MVVKEEGSARVGSGHVGDYDRVPVGSQNVGFEAATAEKFGDQVRTLLDGLVTGRHTWDPAEAGQLFHPAVEVLLKVAVDGLKVGHRLIVVAGPWSSLAAACGWWARRPKAPAMLNQ
jgi:hypothetical protein